VQLTINHTSERADSIFIEAVSVARASKADCRSAGAPRMNRQALEVVIADADSIFSSDM
jgi:hypothetical protein